MKVRGMPVLVCGLLLAGCEQIEQSLPFETSGGVTIREIGSEGGLVSSAAGASVQFPAGALASGETITLSATPAPGSTPSGVPVSAMSFGLAPAGRVLAKPAQVTLKLADRAEETWLASLLNVTPAGYEEIGPANVDLSAGLLRAEVAVLGTLTAILPESAAVVRATPLGQVANASRGLAPSAASAAAMAPTHAVGARCGEPGNRCRMEVQAGESLLALVDDAALVFPRIQGQIDFDTGRATGKISFSAALKTKVGGTGSGERIEVTVETTEASRVSETTDEIILTPVRVTTSGAAARSEELLTLRIRKGDGSESWLAVTRRNILAAGQTHELRLHIPLQRW